MYLNSYTQFSKNDVYAPALFSNKHRNAKLKQISENIRNLKSRYAENTIEEIKNEEQAKIKE